jgi:hypothetical protein
MYHLYDTDYFNLFYLIIIIFVLKFGAWRMSVFATDRRYSDNGILVFSLLRFVIAAVLHVKLSAK